MSHKTDQEEKPGRFSVFRAYPGDSGKPFARLHYKDLELLGLTDGDVVGVKGARSTAAVAKRIRTPFATRSAVHLDKTVRKNAGVEAFEMVELEKVRWNPAAQVWLSFQGCTSCSRKAREELPLVLDGRPLVAGDVVMVGEGNNHRHEFVITQVNPRGVVVYGPDTRLVITEGAREPAAGEAPGFTYKDIGGLEEQLLKIKEIVELPLRSPELFERLGIDPPRGVLLHGPPGTGKTLIARAVAGETMSHFIFINGPEVMNKYYGESEATLRNIFEDAVENTPAIIFLDELDALAPKREEVRGEVEKRVVAQLLALMDGLKSRGQVVVIGATNMVNALDPALRRPGRFDREIAIPVPDQDARLAIIKVHSRDMPLSGDVDLKELARITHGFVGADLAALCREAAMGAIRRNLPGLEGGEKPGPDFLEKLTVTMEDFLAALRGIEPTAIREVFVEVPEVGWNDVGGLKREKELLREMIEWPLKHGELMRTLDCPSHKGILILGPPGCGKTLLAQAVAKESGVNFITVKGPELISKYVGESERGIRETFRKARQASPCIIFFDDLDALASTAGSSTEDMMRRVTSQLMSEMDGVEELKDVVVMAASRERSRIDQALLRPGRFDTLLVLGPPDKAERREIFGIHLAKKPLSPDVDLDELAELSEGMSGADIAKACRESAQEVMRRAVGAGARDAESLFISMEDIKAAVERMRGPGERTGPAGGRLN